MERDAIFQSHNMYEHTVGRNAVRQWIVAVCDCNDFRVTKAQSRASSGGKVGSGSAVTDVRLQELIRKCASKWLRVTRARRTLHDRDQQIMRDNLRHSHYPPHTMVHGGYGPHKDPIVDSTHCDRGGCEEESKYIVRGATAPTLLEPASPAGLTREVIGTPLHRMPPRMPPPDMFNFPSNSSRSEWTPKNAVLFRDTSISSPSLCQQTQCDPSDTRDRLHLSAPKNIQCAVTNEPNILFSDISPVSDVQSSPLHTNQDSIDPLEAVMADIFHSVSHQRALDADNLMDSPATLKWLHALIREDKEKYAQALLDYADMLEAMAKAHS